MKWTVASIGLVVALGISFVIADSLSAQRIREDEPSEPQRRYDGDEALRQMFYEHVRQSDRKVEEAKDVAKEIAKASLEVEHRLTKVEQTTETIMNLLTALCAGVAIQIFNMVWRIITSRPPPKNN